MKSSGIIKVCFAGVGTVLLNTVLLNGGVAWGSPEVLEILDRLEEYNQNKQQLPQVTSASQLRDVSPTDWAFEALRNLVERYGCIVGYPDRTFRGNRAISRNEFAAGLNACMQAIERLQAQGGTLPADDLDRLKRLLREFEAELAALQGKVDKLEGRVAFLEGNQFSTTTKLTGQAVFGLASILNGQKSGGSENIEKVPVFGHRTRLELNTSFTGKDLLYTRLTTGNFPDLAETAETSQATLAFSQPNNNKVAVEVLYYRFPVTDNISVWLEGTGGAMEDFTETISLLDGDGASAALSKFGTRNYIYYHPPGTGIGFKGNWDKWKLSVGYLAFSAASPRKGEGLFNGPYGITGQLGYYPNEDFAIAFTYGHGYNVPEIAKISGKFSNILAPSEDSLRASYNSYSLTMSWRLADNFVIGGWGGYSKVKTLTSYDDGNITIGRGTSDFWYWAVTLGFPDLFKEGSLGGIIVGMPPWQTKSNIRVNGERLGGENSSIHLEAFYQYPINDNISITPGVIIVTKPGNDNRNDPLVIGTIRTTFSF
ncbi:MAG: iron uptake porin [Geminocystis sp.]|nr:iron uptake porin [Geminocystis sp.]MCS7147214.1 iron uptake porin [Geminocystis sp.]MDW8116210.1 iron uptake porin [Geminocystis sp.]MDW8462799.1 iron uptake porin [Geminocystis sp.]